MSTSSCAVHVTIFNTGGKFQLVSNFMELHTRTQAFLCALAIIAERLSARQLIVQRSQFAFVCMYIRHTLIAWARFLWSRPQTTSHVVLVRPGDDRKIVRVREL